MKKKAASGGIKKDNHTQPIRNTEDVRKSKDEKIDQDFPGFPGHPATPAVIKNAGKAKNAVR